ncbi:MAG: DUF177 domain-containing protein [Oscillospiraceae bacterium]|nr:DUF177 domain-containing protein [Oscillospiraceae bacterium]
MLLNLHEIIEMPGGRVPFQCELDTQRLSFDGLVAFNGPVTAEGQVKNTAGILEMDALVKADMTLCCDRCTAEFRRTVSRQFQVTLQADAEDEDDPDLFPLEGDSVDVSDVLETCFILDTDRKLLCREDCKGLCPTCGGNLNDGPCSCKKPIDPRLAVLGQLLDDNTGGVSNGSP